MRFSFIVITDGKSEHKVTQLIASILNQDIPKDEFEIIIIGGDKNLELSIINTRYIAFDDSLRSKAWVTKKKNVGLDAARGKYCVFLHDYLLLGDGWYESMLKFGDFDAAMCPLIYDNGIRAIDWLLAPYDTIPDSKLRSFLQSKFPKYPLPSDLIKLPYEFKDGELSEFMYLPGNFFMVKTELMKKCRQNEELLWGESEDLDWSRRFTSMGYKFKLNDNKICCKFQKGYGRPPGHRYVTEEIYTLLKEFIKENGL